MLENHADAPAGLLDVDPLGEVAEESEAVQVPDHSTRIAPEIVGG